MATETVRYIVMDAPGYYGTYATIYSSHATKAAALKAAGSSKNLMVSTDGGFHANHRKGSVIHREFASRYTRVEG